MPDNPSTAQIGASGVLLIQYRLLKCGIESAPMTTDAGIDLVVYSPKLKEALTVQVKTCLKPKPAGGSGRLALDWWLPSTSPARLVGCVNLEGDEAWIFHHCEFQAKAQQTNKRKWHLYFYVEPDHQPRRKTRHACEFEQFRLENRISEVFGLPQSS